MKKYFIVLFLISLFTNDQFAQRLSAEEQALYLKDMLSLSDSQYAAVDSILKDAQMEISAMRDSGEMDRDRMMEIRNKTNFAIESILNDDQKKLYGKFLEERRERFNRNRNREN